jgi:serine/threonine protein phosphatase PrpC
MKYPISTYIDNHKSMDDCVAIKKIDKKTLLTVVCDGVSSATSGRVASHIISKVIIKIVTARADLLRNKPNQFVRLLFRSLDRIFLRLHCHIAQYNSQVQHSIATRGAEMLSSQERARSKEKYSKNNSNSVWDKIFQPYTKSADINLQDFKELIISSHADKIRFCSTISFLLIEEIEKDIFRVIVFNLGDGYIVKTMYSTESKRWDFKDFAFNRSSDSATPQYDSKNSVVGDYELSVYYTKSNCIISIGSDGCKIKSPEYSGQRQYQYEYFREFSEMLNNSKDDFKKSSEKWHKHLMDKNGIGDDFSLVSIQLI